MKYAIICDTLAEFQALVGAAGNTAVSAGAPAPAPAPAGAPAPAPAPAPAAAPAAAPAPPTPAAATEPVSPKGRPLEAVRTAMQSFTQRYGADATRERLTQHLQTDKVSSIRADQIDYAIEQLFVVQ